MHAPRRSGRVRAAALDPVGIPTKARTASSPSQAPCADCTSSLRRLACAAPAIELETRGVRDMVLEAAAAAGTGRKALTPI
ncbi:hypothetical protein AURDEDRAFT_186053 [Auricularia subglabra TFB-10046 SS5]|nr:hypothetical protein AURDEDRAFT_186053 [Auricularia subglabra TFB-10046 SS5]